MVKIRVLILGLMLFQLTVEASAQGTPFSLEKSLSTSRQLDATLTHDPEAPVDSPDFKIKTTTLTDLTAEEVSQVLNQIDPQDPQAEVVISASQEDTPLIGEILKAQGRTTQRGEKRFDSILLLNPLHRLTEKVKESYNQDHFGFVFSWINYGVTSTVWISISRMSSFQEMAVLGFNFVMTATFSVHKDLWAKATLPIQKRIHALWDKLDRLEDKERNPLSEKGSVRDITAKFISNYILTMGVQTTQASIYFGDRLLHGSGILQMLTTSSLISLVLTWSYVGFDEQIALINKDSHPTAKWFFRRTKEFRGFFMAYVAPTPNLLAYGTHGIGPWIVSLTHGALGFLTYINSEKLTARVDENSFIQSLAEHSEKLKITTPKNAVRCRLVYSL